MRLGVNLVSERGFLSLGASLIHESVTFVVNMLGK